MQLFPYYTVHKKPVPKVQILQAYMSHGRLPLEGWEEKLTVNFEFVRGGYCTYLSGVQNFRTSAKFSHLC